MRIDIQILLENSEDTDKPEGLITSFDENDPDYRAQLRTFWTRFDEYFGGIFIFSPAV